MASEHTGNMPVETVPGLIRPSAGELDEVIREIVRNADKVQNDDERRA